VECHLLRSAGAMKRLLWIGVLLGACHYGLPNDDAHNDAHPDLGIAGGVDAAQSPEAGPTIEIGEPLATQVYRGALPVTLFAGSPNSPLVEVGIDVAGHAELVCENWPAVPRVQCGKTLSVWDLGLPDGAIPVRAWAKDGAGRVAWAEVTIQVHPYQRPRWEFMGMAAVNTPVVSDGLVLAPMEYLYALRPADGSLAWKFGPADADIFNRAKGVVAAGGRAFVVGYGRITALALPAGTVVWDIAAPAGQMSAPVLDQQGHVVVASSHSDLYAYDPATGALAWSFVVPGTTDHIPPIAPVLAPDGSLYERTPDRTLFHVTATGTQLGTALAITEPWVNGVFVDATSGGTIYVSGDHGVRAMSLDGVTRWTWASSGKVLDPARAGAGGRLFVAAQADRFAALDAATGAPLWEHPAAELIRGTPYQAPGGSVYAGILGTGFAYLLDSAGTVVDEYPYCENPDGFAAGPGGQIFCTRDVVITALATP
jgi:outer membrane protein assembly factor BamB